MKHGISASEFQVGDRWKRKPSINSWLITEVAGGKVRGILSNKGRTDNYLNLDLDDWELVYRDNKPVSPETIQTVYPLGQPPKLSDLKVGQIWQANNEAEAAWWEIVGFDNEGRPLTLHPSQKGKISGTWTNYPTSSAWQWTLTNPTKPAADPNKLTLKVLKRREPSVGVV